MECGDMDYIFGRIWKELNMNVIVWVDFLGHYPESLGFGDYESKAGARAIRCSPRSDQMVVVILAFVARCGLSASIPNAKVMQRKRLIFG